MAATAIQAPEPVADVGPLLQRAREALVLQDAARLEAERLVCVARELGCPEQTIVAELGRRVVGEMVSVARRLIVVEAQLADARKQLEHIDEVSERRSVQRYHADLAARTRAALAAKRTRGERLGRPGLAERPELVQRIRDLRQQGLTLRAICEQLNTERVPTARGAASWTPSAIQKVAAGYQRPRAGADRGAL